MSNSIVATTPVIHNIYQASQLNPNSICLDMAIKDQYFSGIVNGSQIDSYLLLIKDINNNLLWSSSPITTVLSSDTNITYYNAPTAVGDSYVNWFGSDTFGQIIDSSFQDIKYNGTGWTANNTKDSDYNYDGSTYYSNSKGDYFTYTFKGATSILGFLRQRNDGGMANVYIDNALINGNLDTYNAHGDTNFVGTNLDASISHILKVVVNGNKNAASTDCFVEFDYLILTPDSNPSCKISHIPNDTATYTFFGSCINCYFRTTPDSGLVDILIDGVLQQTIDTASASITPTVMLYQNINLTTASHTITLRVTGNSNNTFNQYVYFEKFEIFSKTSLLQYVDDSDSLVKYTGSNWKVGIQGFVPFYDNTVHNSSVANDSVSMTFTGTDVFAYFTQGEDKGIMDCYLDGVFQSTVDTYAIGQYIYDGNNPQTLLYSATGLANTNHTVKFVVKGTKNSASTGTRIELDYFKINNGGMNYLYDKDTLTIKVPANLVTLRGALKWQLIYWNSDNNNESVSSGETLFTNMTTPTLSLNVGDVITSRTYDFEANYSQAEKISIQDFDMQLNEIHYQINCGVFGQEVSGTAIDCGDFDTDTGATIRYHINCGTF